MNISFNYPLSNYIIYFANNKLYTVPVWCNTSDLISALLPDLFMDRFVTSGALSLKKDRIC